MENNIPIHLQEVIFSDTDSSKATAQLVKKGLIKKIAPKIYSGKLQETAEAIIRRNLFTILGRLYEGAVISHRSAFELKPTNSGAFFLTYTYTKKIALPGITLHFLEGKGPVEGDSLFIGGLYLAQPARAFLENLQVTKRGGDEAKSLPTEAIEEKLEKIIRVNGEPAINAMRDQARKIAQALSMEKEFDKLNRIISSLLSTHTAKILTSPAAKARAAGAPFDSARVQLFEQLFIMLQQHVFKTRPDLNTTNRSFANFAFFESYFSNYIEGTVFKVSEAKEIIETQRPMPARNEDSHDVLGTYQIVSSRQEMQITPSTGQQLIDILQYRHRILLGARPEKQPGNFKDRDNFAGNTAFVAFDLVRGTLLKGFEYYNALPPGAARAVYMMFLISEVHPFLDGNGRIARVMMNAELVTAGESKIMIPTVYRDDYLGALRRLTRRSDPEAYIGMMERAHAFSANVYGDDRDAMEAYLTSCNAFLEDTEGKILQLAPRS